jgi:cell division protein YceG involved in septum cleavage
MTAILAVLQPAETGYLFFVAHPNDDGSHLFAMDIDSQNQNINFRNGVVDAPAWCSNPWDAGCPLNSG